MQPGTKDNPTITTNGWKHEVHNSRKKCHEEGKDEKERKEEEKEKESLIPWLSSWHTHEFSVKSYTQIDNAGWLLRPISSLLQDSSLRWPCNTSKSEEDIEITLTQVMLDGSSQKRKITPPSPPTVENMKYITRGRNIMKKEKTRRKEKNKKRKRKAWFLD